MRDKTKATELPFSGKFCMCGHWQSDHAALADCGFCHCQQFREIARVASQAEAPTCPAEAGGCCTNRDCQVHKAVWDAHKAIERGTAEAPKPDLAINEKNVADLCAEVVMMATSSHDSGCDCNLCFDGDALCEHVNGLLDRIKELEAGLSAAPSVTDEQELGLFALGTVNYAVEFKKTAAWVGAEIVRHMLTHKEEK